MQSRLQVPMVQQQISGKVLPALVDKSGKVTGDGNDAVAALTSSMNLRNKDVKDVSKFLICMV